LFGRTQEKEITMAKRSTTHEPTLASNDSFAPATDRDIACRAYRLYLARGGEHGHDVDDWLQAERELREVEREAAA
jgi:hypothetical protein